MCSFSQWPSLASTVPSRTSHPLARRGQLPSGTSGHLLSQGLASVRRSGLHVARALVLYDEDRTSQPRMSTPVPRGASSSPRGGHHLCHYQGCDPRTPLSWSHSTRSWMPMEYSHALCRGRSMALCSWIAVRSCGWSVTQPEIMSTLTLCSAFDSTDSVGFIHPRTAQHTWG